LKKLQAILNRKKKRRIISLRGERGIVTQRGNLFRRRGGNYTQKYSKRKGNFLQQGTQGQLRNFWRGERYSVKKGGDSGSNLIIRGRKGKITESEGERNYLV